MDGKAVAETGKGQLAGRRALVADDSAASAAIVAGMLRREGMLVTLVADGRDAVDRVRTSPDEFDVVLLDIVMTHMGGIEAAREIRGIAGSRARIVLLMSATTDPETVARAKEAGVVGEILAKPFRARQVIPAVAGLLSGAPDGLVAEDAALPDLPEVPSLPGADLAGALERCGSDPALLMSLLRTLDADAQRRLAEVTAALRVGRYDAVHRDLHRLRGDLLNLGLPALAGRLHAVDIEVQRLSVIDPARPDDTMPLNLLQGAERQAAMLAGAATALTDMVARIASLPYMQRQRHAQPGEPGLAAEAAPQFSALAAAIAGHDLAALQALRSGARLLPAAYGDDAEREVRARLEALDFDGATALLRAEDRVPPVHAPTGRFRILVVDDAVSAVRMIHGMVEDIGLVRFALSAERALEIAAAWTPDLVISDIHLGGLSGIELCRRLKARPATADTAVVLVSADAEVANEVAALTAGAADFISKPLNPARVVGRVRAHLETLRRSSLETVLRAGDLTGSQLGYVTCSFAGVVIDVSPSLERALGARGTALGGRPLVELFEPDSADLVRASVRTLATTGKVPPFEASVRDGGGLSVPVRVVGWSAPGPSGRIGWLSLEDRRDRVAENRRRVDEEIARIVGTMAGGMAHEFNNLLNVAIGNLDLVEEALTQPALRERIATASKALLRAAEISRRLGDFGLRVRAPGAPQGLDALLDELWPLVLGSIPRNVVVLRDRAPGEALVTLDVQGLRAAFGNVLQNAYEAMPDGGQVVVRTRVEPGAAGAPAYAVLEVEDGGVGMSPETLERAFEPFFSSAAPRRQGLGLTQVRGFVERHGGTVSLSSRPGHGTVVRMQFPAAGAAAPPASVPLR